MKEKMMGLIAVGAIVTARLLTGSYLIWQQIGEDLYGILNTGLNLGIGLGKSGVGNVPKVDVKTQKTIRRLQKKLPELRTPGLSKRGRVDFEMLGYELPKPGDPRAKLEDETFEDYGFGTAKRQVVSMTYVSQGIRYAVVNGKLYKEGDALNEELRIEKITPHKILIVGQASSQWIKTSNRVRKKDIQTGSSRSTADTSGRKKAAAKVTKESKPKSKIEQITEGLKAIQHYSDTLKSLE